MTFHPDPDTLLAFRQHRLAGSRVVAIARHLEECDACGEGSPAEAASLLRAIALPDAGDHLTDEQIDAILDGDVELAEYQSVSQHLSECAMCRAELDDLREFEGRQQTTAGNLRKRMKWLLPIAACLIVAIVAGVFLLRRRATSNPRQQNALTNTTRPRAVPPSRVVSNVIDHDRTIAALENGTIKGVGLRSNADAEIARAALIKSSLEIPAFIPAMGSASPLRSSSGSVSGVITHLEPFESAVRESRPQFQWSPLANARSYRVAVFDAQYNEIAHSEALHKSSWTPPRDLPAGVDLSWQVVADTAQGEVSSSGPEHPEATFRILDVREAAEAGRAVDWYSKSHLMRALLFAHYGLMHDSERELRDLQQQNPNSAVVSNLLDTVQSRGQQARPRSAQQTR